MKIKLTLFILLTFTLKLKMYGATVTSVHGKHLQLKQDDGEDFSEDQKYYIVNEAGKKVGLVKILSVSLNKTTAILLKGKVSEGNHTQAANTPSSTSAHLPIKLFMFVLGINANSLSTSGSQNNLYSLHGQSFSFEANQESFLDNNFTARYGIEFNNFIAKAKIYDLDRSVNVLYFGFKGDINYFMSQNFYGGLGFSYLIPVSKNSENLFAKEDINNNAALSLSFGQWFRGKNSSVPLVFKYSQFLGNKNVSSSILSIQTGIAW